MERGRGRKERGREEEIFISMNWLMCLWRCTVKIHWPAAGDPVAIWLEGHYWRNAFLAQEGSVCFIKARS